MDKVQKISRISRPAETLPSQQDQIAEALHDLMQPLTAISNYAATGCRLAAAPPGSGRPEPEELFSRIHEQTQRLKDLCLEMQELLNEDSSISNKTK